MKKIKKDSLTKQIICIIIFLMLYNFIIPSYCFAVSTEGGGSLLDIIVEMACFIPDKVIEFLQKMFVSIQGIKTGGKYEILYSPGTIFSGQIPAFDINFIKPKTPFSNTRYLNDMHDNSSKISYDKFTEITKDLVANGYETFYEVAEFKKSSARFAKIHFIFYIEKVNAIEVKYFWISSLFLSISIPRRTSDETSKI